MELGLNKIPENIKAVLTSSAPLVVVIILFIFAGQFGFSKVSDIRAQIDKAQKDNSVLTQKLNLLQEVSSSLAAGSGVAVTALPDKNPSIVVLSQIKNIALSAGVTLGNIKAGDSIQDNSGLFRVDISFEATGARPQIISFLQNIEKIAPITRIDKIKINESGGAALTNITLKSFFSPLPTTIPPVTQAISDLTPAEKTILTNITNLTQPTFVDLPASGGSGRTDPF